MRAPERGRRRPYRDGDPAQHRNGPVVVLLTVVGALMLSACLIGAFAAAVATHQ